MHNKILMTTATLLILATLASAIKPGEVLITVSGLINATYPCVVSGDNVIIAYDAPVGNSTCVYTYQAWVDDTTTTTLKSGGGGNGGGGHSSGPPDYVSNNTGWWWGGTRPLITPTTISNPPQQPGQVPILIQQPVQVNIPPAQLPPQKEYVYVNQTVEVPKNVEVPQEDPYRLWLIILTAVSLLGVLIIGCLYLWLQKRHTELQDENEALRRRIG